jgi:hypothetical protein
MLRCLAATAARLHVRDDGEAPLCMRRDAPRSELICGEDKAACFSRGGWTGGIGLMRLAKTASAGSGICLRPGQGACAERNRIDPLASWPANQRIDRFDPKADPICSLRSASPPCEPGPALLRSRFDRANQHALQLPRFVVVVPVHRWRQRSLSFARAPRRSRSRRRRSGARILSRNVGDSPRQV